MKPGRRAVGIAESFRGTDDGTTESTLAGAVVRADRTVDDFVFGTCTVGGSDGTGAVADLWERLDRPDVQYVFLAGVALAWYNVVDLQVLADRIDRPVVAVSFEASDGLESAIEDAFDGDARDDRLATYRSLPPRRRLQADPPLFARSVGLGADETDRVVDAYTHERRPDPLRVAKRLAGRADDARRGGRLPAESGGVNTDGDDRRV
ncbi:UPF0215 family protein [Natronomonas pharaonis DSM 2160]|uniref:UPF0215 protein NP_0086A n=1 Tax=Natronomonas pharaonis (strain ATCC 35678 / DSM 2160 / CIP 103997 / JCM 8858 / NBRC 14720 / NCIMB 2260 / Gabara) TaxID=348780 RepID=A0A1U7ETC1_NATPD|nr:DUF99 family protein [Natronomonas pharaonis]CAI48134.1 UPF0215 family protein [Natronomonas pharaonis DSM 2160]